MYIDANQVFDPAATAITVTADSTNILDMGVGRDMGVGDGEALKVCVLCETTFTAAGAATMVIQILGAADNGGVPGTFYNYGETDALAVADCVAGKKLLDVDLPRKPPHLNVETNPRFYKLHYVIATGPMTAGKVQSWLAPGIEARVDYASGFTVNN